MPSAKQPTMRPTGEPVGEFIAQIPATGRREDASRLCEIMQDITGEEPVMWGATIVGFGSYHYQYDNGREGDAPAAAFSPRKQHMVVYSVGGFAERYPKVLERLGPHTTSKGCLYFKKLDDLNESALREIIERTYRVKKGVDTASKRDTD